MSRKNGAPADTRPIEEFDLLDALMPRRWFKLPIAVMCDVGPAVQTLAGILKTQSGKETFAAVSKIASDARVPPETARKHLRRLQAGNWLVNAGRERTRRGRPRRTCTWRITSRTVEASQEYGVLPWWACDSGFPWSSKAVLSVVMARMMSLKAAIEEQTGDRDEFWGSLEHFGDEDRFAFKLDALEQQTGLARNSVIAAKADLHHRGLVQWSEKRRDDGGFAKDVLYPNESFRIVVTPTQPGMCRISFRVA